MQDEIPSPEPEPRRGVFAAVRAEVRRHAIAYAVVAAFMVIGPLLVRMIFPEAPLLLGLIGGLLFGVYAALSAVPDRFYE